jgi:ribA/ribD-fused uncharacterized protein
MSVVNRFSGEYAFLSNFYPSPVVFMGKEYASVEHGFQAHKMTTPKDHERVRLATTSGNAKRIARAYPMREDWDLIREDVMLYFLKLKFQIPDLRAALIKTGDAQLIEGNTWGDTYWGICKGEGLNRLGILLMQIRSEIQQ